MLDQDLIIEEGTMWLGKPKGSGEEKSCPRMLAGDARLASEKSSPNETSSDSGMRRSGIDFFPLGIVPGCTAWIERIRSGYSGEGLSGKKDTHSGQ
jgi:hypothetical protein